MPETNKIKERPIIFNGEMVRAILDCRKTQTRRVVKNLDERSWLEGANNHIVHALDKCPYGKVGDELYVREKFKQVASGQVKNSYGEVRYGYAYEADNSVIWSDIVTKIHDLTGQPDSGALQFKTRPWKPSIYMPRIASRIQLKITDIRIERVQAISEGDAIQEGIKRVGSDFSVEPWKNYGKGRDFSAPSRSFQSLWQSINGPDAWDANPFVWVVSFERINKKLSEAT